MAEPEYATQKPEHGYTTQLLHTDACIAPQACQCVAIIDYLLAETVSS